MSFSHLYTVNFQTVLSFRKSSLFEAHKTAPFKGERERGKVRGKFIIFERERERERER